MCTVPEMPYSLGLTGAQNKYQLTFTTRAPEHTRRSTQLPDPNARISGTSVMSLPPSGLTTSSMAFIRLWLITTPVRRPPPVKSSTHENGADWVAPSVCSR